MTKEELLARLDSTEWEDFEVKDASHGIPKSVWETVSAFSNGKGGWILLGVRESKEDGIPGYEIVGLNDVENVEQSMGTTLRSTTKFNAPILATVEMHEFDGKKVLLYWIPPSDYKPIYLNNNLSNTFIRVGSGDQKATDIEIAVFMREKTFGSKSDIRVHGTTLADLN